MLFTILRLRRPLPCLGGSGGVSLWSWPEGSGSTKRERERNRSTAGENSYGVVGLGLLYGQNRSILRMHQIFKIGRASCRERENIIEGEGTGTATRSLT